MSDPRIIPTPDGAELVEGADDLEVTDTLENAALLSMFGGNVADDQTADSRGQWWGNHVLPTESHLRGATQRRVAAGPPITSSERQSVERAALQDLEWMVPDYASRVDARVALSGPDELAVLAAVEEAPGRVVLVRPAVPRAPATWSSRTHPRLVTVAITEPADGAVLPVLEGLTVRVTTTGPAAAVRVEAGTTLLDTTQLSPTRWLAELELGAEHLGPLHVTVTADNERPGVKPVQTGLDATVTNPTTGEITSPAASSMQWEEVDVPVVVTTTGLVDSVRADLTGAGEAELVEGPEGVWTGSVSTNGENDAAHLRVYLTPTGGVEYEADDVVFEVVSAAPGYPTFYAWGLGALVGEDPPEELVSGLTYDIYVEAPPGNVPTSSVAIMPGWDGSGTLPEIECELLDGDPTANLWKGSVTIPSEWVGELVTFELFARNAYAETQGASESIPCVASAEWVSPSNGAVLRWGETLTVDVQTSGDVDHVDISIGASYTTEAEHLGDGLYRATLTLTDAHYGTLAISATVTPSVGDPLALDGLSVTVKIDNPVYSSGRTIPAVGSVPTWGDLGLSSGTATSSGSVVRLGDAPASGGYRITPTASLNPGHTIVVLMATAASTIQSGGRAATVTTPGCGLILDLTSSSGGRAQTQVFNSAGGYVGAVSAALANPHGWHLLASNRDPATGTTRIYIDGVLAASSVIAATQVAVSTPFYIAGIGGDQFRFAGVWNRQLSAADLVQLRTELEAEIAAAPIAQTGAVPAAGAVAAWGSYAQGTPANQPTSDGSAVVFDGTNDRLTHTNATTGFSGRITAAVRWSSATATWDDYPTMGVRGTCGWLIQGTTGTKEVKVLVANAAGTFIELHAHTFDDIEVPHTISFAWDHQAASGTVVIDGVLVDTHAQALSRDNTGSATHELGYDSTGPRYLNGKVYDARLFLGVAMTVAQQQALHADMAA